MPSFSEKLSMYLSATQTSPSTVARWIGLTPVKLSQVQAGQSFAFTPEHYQRLAEETGIPENVWKDDKLSLPAELVAARRGRKVREETPDFTQTQNLRRQRLKQLIETRFENNRNAFAEAIAKDDSAVSHYLKRRTVTDAFCLHVAKALNISADWLKNGIGAPDDIKAPPTPTAHQGELLGRYLDEHQISNRQMGILMGYSEAAASGAVRQFRESRQLRPEIRANISNVLNVTEGELFALNNLKNSENNYGNILKLASSRNKSTHPRVTPSSADTSRTVQLTQIPAFLRSGFHYDAYMPEAPLTTIPFHLIRRLQNPNLSPEQQTELVDRYDSIIIGTDYMEPSLLPGYEVTMFRFKPEQWGEENGVLAIETRAGRLFIGRVTDNTLNQTGSISLVCDNPKGGSLTVERDQIANLWKLETFVGQVV